MAKYQVQLHQVTQSGTDVPLFPITSALDVKVGKLSAGALTLPGDASDEILAQTLANIKKYLYHLGTVAETMRGVSSSTTSSSEVDLATSAAVNTLRESVDANTETLKTNTEAIAGKAPKNHATSDLTFGGATATNYGHVKLSDTYSSSVTNGTAANSLGASQYAVYRSYYSLNSAKAPNNHATTSTTYGIGTDTKYGHVKLSDTYASKVNDGSATDGLAASQNALYEVYNELSNSCSDLDSVGMLKAPIYHRSTDTTYGVGNSSYYGHLKLSDSYSSSYTTSNGIAATPYCVYSAYDTLLSKINTKLEASHTSTYGTGSTYGHVLLSDNYTSSAGAASSSVGSSSYAVYQLYCYVNSMLNTYYYTSTTVNSLLANKSDTSHTHSYLPLSGGTLSGDINVTKSSGAAGVYVNQGSRMGGLRANGSYFGLWSTSCNNWLLHDNNTSNELYTPRDFLIGGEIHCTNIWSKYYDSSCNTCISLEESAVVLKGVSSVYVKGVDHVRPSSEYDCNINLGTGSNRWKTVYASTATISTSDRNQKKDIEKLTDVHKQFFMKLIPVSFMFKNNTSGRTHIGFIAQDVEDAMNEVGLSALDFAGFCKDVKTKTTEDDKDVPDLDENGNVQYIYSLRYEEFIAINTFVLQDAQNRIDALEEKMEKVLAKLDL